MSDTPAIGMGTLYVEPAAPARAMFPRLASTPARYGVALSAAGLAIGLALSLKIATGADHLMLLLIAVVFVAWMTDLATTLMTVLITGVAAAFVAFDPVFSFGIDTVADTSKLVLFLVLAPVAALVAENIRRTQTARERALAEIQVLNRQLGRAVEAKDEFIAFLAHEVRGPLTVISGGAQVLARAETIEDEARQLLVTDIRDQADRLRQSIEDLLVLARLDRGDSLPTEPVLLNRILDDLIREHRRMAPARKFVLTTPAPVVVEAVPTYLRHAIENLITNAEKYSPAEFPIEIVIHADATQARVDVCDRGPGIPASEREAIFSAFYRSRATATMAGGAGVGLTVTRRLMEAQGGDVRVLGRAGGGSLFRLSLPLDYSSLDT